MKNFLCTLALFATILSLSNCKKDSTTSGYNLAFYTLDSASNYHLVFDSVNKGHLPYIKSGANDCSDSRALRISSLPAGSHTIQAVDSLGTVYASGTVTLANNTINTSGTKGMVGSISINTCGVIDLEQ
jgi:hypothetical protein